MFESSWSTFAEGLLLLLCLVGAFGPIRYAVIAYLISTELDFASIRGAEVPWLNAMKGIGFPLLLVFRLDCVPLRPSRWPVAAKLWLLFTLYAGAAILWSPDQVAGLKMLWYLIEIPMGFTLMSAAYERNQVTVQSIRMLLLGSLVLACLQTYMFGNVFGGLPGDLPRFTAFTSPQVFGQFLVYAIAALLFSERRRLVDNLLIALAAGAIALDGSRLAFVGLFSVFTIRAWYYLKAAKDWHRSADRIVWLGLRAGALATVLLVWLALAPDGRITGFARADGLEHRGGTLGFRVEMYDATVNNLLGNGGGMDLQRLVFGGGTSSGGQIATTNFTRYDADKLDVNRIIHNEFLRALYEWGLLGLFFMLAAFTAAFIGIWRLGKATGLRSKAAIAIFPTILFSFLTENALGGACMCSWVMACIVMSSAWDRNRGTPRYRKQLQRIAAPLQVMPRRRRSSMNVERKCEILLDDLVTAGSNSSDRSHS
jgi:hypothetical protein